LHTRFSTVWNEVAIPELLSAFPAGAFSEGKSRTGATTLERMGTPRFWRRIDQALSPTGHGLDRRAKGSSAGAGSRTGNNVEHLWQDPAQCNPPTAPTMRVGTLGMGPMPVEDAPGNRQNLVRLPFERETL